MENNDNKNSSSSTTKLWDVKSAAEYLGVSQSWVYNAVASGHLPCIRLGGLLRFDPESLRQWALGADAPSIRRPGCREVKS